MSSAAVVNVAEQELRWLNIGHAAEYGHIVKAAFQGARFRMPTTDTVDRICPFMNISR